MVNLCILAAISIVIGVGGILTVSLVYTLTGRTVPMDYGVVVDAGSTHTQIILYKWEGDKENGTGEVLQQDTCYIDGGLALNTDPKAAARSLEGCLKSISSGLPAGATSTTPIFLGATAGFRLLNESNPDLSDDILDEVNQTFGMYGFNPEQVRILTGQQEGFFAWVTSNFLTHTLTGPPPITTVGAMDLGGASTQIAFSTPEEDDSTTFVTLYGSDHNVSSTSSLCFGVKEAYRRHLAELATVAVLGQINISEPCAPVNYTFNMTESDLFDIPCTKTAKPSTRLQRSNYTFVGTGNLTLCRDSVVNLFNISHCEEKYGPKHCFQSVTPPTTENFFAFSSFFFTAEFLNVTGKPLSKFQEARSELCQKTWDEVKNMPTGSNDTLPKFCFQAVLIEHMLIEKYQFDNSTWQNIRFVKKLNSADVGWSLGYMINATNLIPAEAATSPSISLVAMILVSIVCVGLLTVGAFFIWKQKRLASEVSYIQV